MKTLFFTILIFVVACNTDSSSGPGGNGTSRDKSETYFDSQKDVTESELKSSGYICDLKQPKIDSRLTAGMKYLNTILMDYPEDKAHWRMETTVLMANQQRLSLSVAAMDLKTNQTVSYQISYTCTENNGTRECVSGQNDSISSSQMPILVNALQEKMQLMQSLENGHDSKSSCQSNFNATSVRYSIGNGKISQKSVKAVRIIAEGTYSITCSSGEKRSGNFSTVIVVSPDVPSKSPFSCLETLYARIDATDGARNTMLETELVDAKF